MSNQVQKLTIAPVGSDLYQSALHNGEQVYVSLESLGPDNDTYLLKTAAGAVEQVTITPDNLVIVDTDEMDRLAGHCRREQVIHNLELAGVKVTRVKTSVFGVEFLKEPPSAQCKIAKVLSGILETVRSIPFAGIVRTIFSGDLGWRTPLAFVLQFVLQTAAVVLFFDLSKLSTAFVSIMLIAVNLAVGFVLGLLVAETASPPGKKLYASAKGYRKVALKVSLALSGLGGTAVLIPAAFWSSAEFSALVCALAVSALGGTAIHLFGVVQPIYRQMAALENRTNK